MYTNDINETTYLFNDANLQQNATVIPQNCWCSLDFQQNVNSTTSASIMRFLNDTQLK